MRIIQEFRALMFQIFVDKEHHVAEYFIRKIPPDGTFPTDVTKIGSLHSCTACTPSILAWLLRMVTQKCHFLNDNLQVQHYLSAKAAWVHPLEPKLQCGACCYSQGFVMYGFSQVSAKILACPGSREAVPTRGTSN